MSQEESNFATSTFSLNSQDRDENISSKILSALSEVSNIPEEQLKFSTHAIAGIGENSYGLVLQVILSLSEGVKHEIRYILKIAPKNSARRSHMRVADYYAREVFMYRNVFEAYRKLTLESNIELMNLMPEMLYYSLDECNEFIIFEDLTQSNYIVGKRTQLPDYDMVAMALRTLGKFHGLSFALQAKKSNDFMMLIAQLQPDNLFTPNIEPISIEFGKSYIRRAMNMIQIEPTDMMTQQYVETLQNVEDNFKRICLHCVNGCACAPYAVICHGDFWNNNILIKYDHNNKTVISAKLIDFQMSRYASPILDLVHFIFVCTSYELREMYFESLLYDVYYATLSEQLQQFKLNISSIYPRKIFESQLHDYGVYGLCMAAFSLPFFIADTTELPDLDKVSEAIKDIGTEAETVAGTTKSKHESNDQDLNESRLKLIEEDFNLLTPRTAKIFKLRMIGIVADIIKYGIKTDIGH